MPRVQQQEQQPAKPGKKQPSAAQLRARAEGAKRLQAAREAKAREDARVKPRRPVRSTRQFVDAPAHVRDEADRVLPSRGKARLEVGEVHKVDKMPSKAKLEELAFMEEPVTIRIHESTNPNDDPLPEVINGGRHQYFIRGQEQTVKRKFVEILARARVTTRRNVKFVNSQGDEDYRYPAQTALRFPFEVLQDSEKGRAWLKRLLQEQQEGAR